MEELKFVRINRLLDNEAIVINVYRLQHRMSDIELLQFLWETY